MLVLLNLIACAPDPGASLPHAEVVQVDGARDAPAAGMVVPAIAAAKVLPIDVEASKVSALGAKVTATHPIVFHRFDGHVGLDGEQVTGVAFVVDIASIESDSAKLTAHLLREDFLHVAAFPYATFVSTQIQPDGASGAATVTGDLTIRGKTLRVSFPATIAVEPQRATATANFVVNRQDFGVLYPGKADNLVQDNVALEIAFSAPR